MAEKLVELATILLSQEVTFKSHELDIQEAAKELPDKILVETDALTCTPSVSRKINSLYCYVVTYS